MPSTKTGAGSWKVVSPFAIPYELTLDLPDVPLPRSDEPEHDAAPRGEVPHGEVPAKPETKADAHGDDHAKPEPKVEPHGDDHAEPKPNLKAKEDGNAGPELKFQPYRDGRIEPEPKAEPREPNRAKPEPKVEPHDAGPTIPAIPAIPAIPELMPAPGGDNRARPEPKATPHDEHEKPERKVEAHEVGHEKHDAPAEPKAPTHAAPKAEADLSELLVVAPARPGTPPIVERGRLSSQPAKKLLDRVAVAGKGKLEWSLAAEKLVADRMLRIDVVQWPLHDLVHLLADSLELVSWIDGDVIRLATPAESPKELVDASRWNLVQQTARTALLAAPHHVLAPAVAIHLGRLELSAERTTQAILCYEEAIRRQVRGPWTISAWYDLGIVHSGRGDVHAARRAFFAAIDQSPGHPLAPLAYAHVARLEIEDGSIGPALTTLTRIRRNYPNDPTQAVVTVLTALAQTQAERFVSVRQTLVADRKSVVASPYRDAGAFLEAYALYPARQARKQRPSRDESTDRGALHARRHDDGWPRNVDRRQGLPRDRHDPGGGPDLRENSRLVQGPASSLPGARSCRLFAQVRPARRGGGSVARPSTRVRRANGAPRRRCSSRSSSSTTAMRRRPPIAAARSGANASFPTRRGSSPSGAPPTRRSANSRRRAVATQEVLLNDDLETSRKRERRERRTSGCPQWIHPVKSELLSVAHASGSLAAKASPRQEMPDVRGSVSWGAWCGWLNNAGPQSRSYCHASCFHHDRMSAPRRVDADGRGDAADAADAPAARTDPGRRRERGQRRQGIAPRSAQGEPGRARSPRIDVRRRQPRVQRERRHDPR